MELCYVQKTKENEHVVFAVEKYGEVYKRSKIGQDNTIVRSNCVHNRHQKRYETRNAGWSSRIGNSKHFEKPVILLSDSMIEGSELETVLKRIEKKPELEEVA